MFFSIIGAALIIFALSFFFVLMGRSIYSCIPENAEHPLSLKCSLSYFFGMSCFIVIYIFSAHALNDARKALFISLSILLVTGILKLRKTATREFFRAINYKLLSFILLVSFISPIISPIHSLGSLHSIPYGNIATYILEYNNIPRLGLHYGQSILASIPMLLGFNNPHLALYIWLSVSIFALSVFFYGFFKYLSINDSIATLGTFILMFGNTTLSLIHVRVLSSGSPFIMNGYTDSLASIATFFGLFICLNSCYTNKYKSILHLAVIPAILGISWSIYAPQSIFLYAVVMIGAILYKRNREVIIIALIFFLGSIAGITQGGMLSPPGIIEKLPIPELKTIHTGRLTGISPEMPFIIRVRGVPQQVIWKIKGVRGKITARRCVNRLKNLFSRSPIPITLAIWRLENNFWEALRVAFFPIMGIILLGFIVMFAGRASFSHAYLEEYNTEKMKNFLTLSEISFVLGFFIAFLFVFSGYKKPLSRFLMYGYCTGMISLVISINMLVNKINKKKAGVFIWGLITFFVTIGPVSKLGRRLDYQISTMKSLGVKIEKIVSTNGMNTSGKSKF